MALSVLAYNLTRVMNIVRIKPPDRCGVAPMGAYRTERMFDCLSAMVHGFWVSIELLLHGLEQVIMRWIFSGIDATRAVRLRQRRVLALQNGLKGGRFF